MNVNAPRPVESFEVRRSRRLWQAALCGLVLLAATEARALIVGGEGNEPIRDPGWPAGAAAVFNDPARVAWWEGPPFGGGQWHGEYRGDAAALNDALAAFAKVDAPVRRVVLHDGVGRSFWLNPNDDEAKRAAARIDWAFVVWQKDRWEMQRKLPAEIRPPDVKPDADPIARIDVYTGGDVDWSEVKVPEGIEIVDQRLVAHGFGPDDGTVLEGKVVGPDGDALPEARVRLERIEPQQTGGYRYEPTAAAEADPSGLWVLKSVPAGWYRIVAEAEGHVSRVAGYVRTDGQPRWSSHEATLAKPAAVAGRVADAKGRPLAEVEVRLDGLTAGDGGRYELPHEATAKTDAEGRFRFGQVPEGRARVWLRKPGYVRPGLGPEITTPATDLSFEMTASASVAVTVRFDGRDRPSGYIVKLVPEDGEAVGRWSGTANVDASGVVRFEAIPPGRYVLTGRPNPGSDREETAPVTLDLRGGEETTATIDPR